MNNKINNNENYCENMDEIIEQKNLVEQIEGKVLYLKNQKEIYKEKNQFPYIPVILPTNMIMALIVAPLLLNGLTAQNTNTELVETIFGTMSETASFVLTTSAILLPIGAIAEGISYYMHRKSIKEEKGVDLSLEYLEWQLIEEKGNLEKIKNKQKSDNKDIKVNSLETLKKIRKDLDFYYDIGYNAKEYYQYYKDGVLDDKLKDKYNEEEIRSIESYMHNNGHLLLVPKKEK